MSEGFCYFRSIGSGRFSCLHDGFRRSAVVFVQSSGGGKAWFPSDVLVYVNNVLTARCDEHGVAVADLSRNPVSPSRMLQLIPLYLSKLADRLLAIEDLPTFLFQVRTVERTFHRFAP